MRKLNDTELVLVTGAGESSGDCQAEKANNGWGNGADPIPGNSAKIADGFKQSGDSVDGGASPDKFGRYR